MKIAFALVVSSFVAGPIRSAEPPGEKVLSILQANCVPCHNEGTRTSGFTIKDLPSVMAGGAKYGAAVRPGQVSQSPLAKLLRGQLQPQMPVGKTMAEADIAAIESWIQSLPSELATKSPSQAAAWWAFQKPVPRTPPQVNNAAWARNEIDKFILARLEDKGLTPAPEADRRTLIRRLCFDLIGVPPGPEEIRAFVEDSSPRAYEKLVDRLLADPRYGERWARHWLDLARYSDSLGYEGDPDMAHTWRYRDYVIDAFNNDKPYDQFIREQLAGDEFYRVTGATQAPPPDPEKNVALTFLRLAPFNRTPVSEENRDALLSEMTSTASSVFLGLTVGCAKCHDHKYDPIPQKDFYRMQAFFATVYIPPSAAQIAGKGDSKDLMGGVLPADFYRPGEKERVARSLARYHGELEKSEAEFNSFCQPLLDRLTAYRSKVAAEHPPEKTPEKEATKKKLGPAQLRTVLEYLGEDAEKALFSAAEKEQFRTLNDRLERLKAQVERLEPVAFSLRNFDGPPLGPDVPTTYVLIRGAYDRRGEPVEPGFLSAVEGHARPAELELDRYRMFPERGRRMTLADWIASPENPLTARVMVNRLWHHHFGRGIVETPSDFGKNGKPPTHPELLDWLAMRFVENKWSIKAMHRLILNSASYRQASAVTHAKEEAADPDNRLLWRFNRRRLEGEVIRDSILSVSGRLNPDRGGPPVFPPLPEGLASAQAVHNVDMWDVSPEPDSLKRSIYIYQRRALNFPFLDVFDAPVFNTPCDRRKSSLTPLQALAMYDSGFVNDEARYFAERLRKESGADAGTLIQRAFELALGRPPVPEEVQRARKFLSGAQPDQALVQLCRVLMNTNEFLYVD